MPFGKTYREIQELVREKLLDTNMCRAIVRRAGAHFDPSGGPGLLVNSGEPWEAITKLSDEDFDVGWRKGGLGPDLAQKWNAGPPCNLRTISFTRLRDSLLRSGTDNASRFGYAFDPHAFTPSDGGWLHRAGAWEGAAVISLYNTISSPRWGVDESLIDLTDDVILVTKDQARFICYVTRADYSYTIKLTLRREPATGTNPVTYAVDLTSTGRYVSDWYDFPAYDPSTHDPSFGTNRPYGDGFTTASIEATEEDPAVSPSTYEELQQGAGPLCCPFFEVEVRTVYYAESSYWIQDEYTPEDYRVA